ncbi:MAG: glycosyltransferase family 2 protein [bacterium]
MSGDQTLCISVVIPSLNQGKFIETAIKSVIDQNYPETELIIIDGGSSDNTVETIKKFENSITFFVSKPDNGQSDALNKGFEKASGDIFCWLNSDDFFLPGAFQIVSELFNKNSDISVVYGNWLTVEENGETVEKCRALPARNPSLVHGNMDAYNQSMFWRRKAHSGFKFDTNLSRLMDNDFIIYLLKNSGPENFFRTDEYLGAFRIHESQKTPLYEDKVRIKESAYLEKKYGFAPRGSMNYIFSNLKYRIFQLYHTIKLHGITAATEKIKNGLKRGRKII